MEYPQQNGGSGGPPPEILYTLGASKCVFRLFQISLNPIILKRKHLYNVDILIIFNGGDGGKDVRRVPRKKLFIYVGILKITTECRYT